MSNSKMAVSKTATYQFKTIMTVTVAQSSLKAGPTPSSSHFRSPPRTGNSSDFPATLIRFLLEEDGKITPAGQLRIVACVLQCISVIWSMVSSNKN